MRSIIFIVFFCLSSIGFGQGTKKVLFLGNSYTGVNNLPQMVADVAASINDLLIFQSNTPGGYTFNGHSTNATSLSLIQSGGWDFVVLQEQSQLPSFPIAQVQSDCFPYATLLDSLITAVDSCAETMFYMTWGRQNGDAANCPTWPPVCTYAGMDSLLRLRYDQMAVDNHAVLSPVGALWRYIRTHHPTINLYSGDGSHPSLAGSYAAACSFYSAIFRKDPTLIATDLGLSAMDALTIRNAAKAVVYDSLLTWHIGEYDPVADFLGVNQLNDLNVSFTNTSTNATNYLWDFGDGNSSTDAHPIHTFSNYGSYDVQLIVSHCGLSDTITQTIYLWISSLNEAELLPLTMSPNPVEDILTIHFENADEITVFDLVGRTMDIPMEEKQNSYELNFSHLAQGEYIVYLRKGELIYSGKILR
jgi:PKD domain/Secretion system C-terminal sorting domain